MYPLQSDNAYWYYFQNEVVNVRIPRFQIGGDTGSSIQEALKSIGLTDIFDKNQSDLTLMAPNNNLHLTSIAHR